jgi:hypothetical protein
MDVRLSLGEIEWQAGAHDDARLRAQYVLKLSRNMHYRWGVVGAEALLARASS